MTRLNKEPRANKAPVAKDGVNNDPLRGDASRSVAMDGMNKDPPRGGGSRAVVMDGMNKDPSFGGVHTTTIVTWNIM